MQLGKFFHKYIGSILLVSILLLSMAAVATFEYGINPNNNRPNAFIGQGYISTSKDSRLFNATGADLQKAIYYCNDTAGVLILLPQGTITITDEILLVNSVTVRGVGNWETRLYLSTNDAGINISSEKSGNEQNCSRLHDVYIYTDGDYTGTALTVYAHGGEAIQKNMNLLDNIFIENTGTGASKVTGTGLLLKADAGAGHTSIGYNTFGDISVEGFDYGVHFFVPESGVNGRNGWINANEFDHFELIYCKHMLYLEANNTAAVDGTAQCSGNFFEGISMQGSNNPQTVEGINLTGNCNTNYFAWVRPWDWASQCPAAMQLNLSVASDNNYIIENFFRGPFYRTSIQSTYNEWENMFPCTVKFTDRLNNNGTCTVSANDNSVVVSHNTYIRKSTDAQDDGVEPVIMINPGENITACGVGSWWVDTVTHTQFTLHTDNKVSSDCTFYWTASLDYYTWY